MSTLMYCLALDGNDVHHFSLLLLKSMVRGTDTDKMIGFRRFMGILSGLHEVFEFQDMMISTISSGVHLKLLEFTLHKLLLWLHEER